MREDNIVTAEGRICMSRRRMHYLAETVTILLYCPSALISPIMHCQLVSKVFSALTDLRQP